MPQSRLETFVALPPGEVFRLAAALGRMGEWLPGVRSVGGLEPGQSVAVTFGDGSRQRTMITDVEPGVRVSRRWAHSNGLWGTSRWALTAEGRGTRLVADLFWVLPEAGERDVDPVRNALLEAHFANELGHFRVWAEAGGAVRPTPRAA